MSSVKDHYMSLASHIKQKMDTPIIIEYTATFDQSLSNIKDNPFDAVCISR